MVQLIEQIENIKSYGLSSVLCDTLDNPVVMQEKALLQPWRGRISNRMYVTARAAPQNLIDLHECKSIQFQVIRKRFRLTTLEANRGKCVILFSNIPFILTVTMV